MVWDGRRTGGGRAAAWRGAAQGEKLWDSPVNMHAYLVETQTLLLRKAPSPPTPPLPTTARPRRCLGASALFVVVQATLPASGSGIRHCQPPAGLCRAPAAAVRMSGQKPKAWPCRR